MRESIKIRNSQALEQLNTDVLHKGLFAGYPGLLLVINCSGQFIEFNNFIEPLFGYSKDTLLYSSFIKYIHPDDQFVMKKTFEEVVKGDVKVKDFRIVHKNGSVRFVNITAVPAIINGETLGIYGFVKDITESEIMEKGITVINQDFSERKKVEETIHYMTYHDNLTGLPNRHMLESWLYKELIKMTSSNKKLAIVCINLDRFKVINDSLGLQIGDLLLKKVTERLQTCVNDKCQLFRNAGDEFFVILPDVNRETSSEVCVGIIEALSDPFIINKKKFFTSASVGISMFPDNGESVEHIIRNANFAMYQAKNDGGNTYQFYTKPYVNNKLNPLKVEVDLHKAIERNELELHYQPKVHLKTGEMVGVEALIRWNHPEWGMVLPGDFIPIAEDSGLIIPIGEWAIKTACTQNKIWHEMGLSTVIAVNLSPRQFAHSNLIQTIKTTLKETRLKPQYLEFELTENMMADIKKTITILKAIKRLGVKISIDDFGTGFSSFNYLKQFPVDTLKIDRSFVQGIPNNSKDETIVKTMISLAHNLNINVVAEGIETIEQLQFFQQNFCDEGQGFFFSKPALAKNLAKKVQDIQKEMRNSTNIPHK